MLLVDDVLRPICVPLLTSMASCTRLRRFCLQGDAYSEFGGEHDPVDDGGRPLFMDVIQHVVPTSIEEVVVDVSISRKHQCQFSAAGIQTLLRKSPNLKTICIAPRTCQWGSAKSEGFEGDKVHELLTGLVDQGLLEFRKPTEWCAVKQCVLRRAHTSLPPIRRPLDSHSLNYMFVPYWPELRSTSY